MQPLSLFCKPKQFPGVRAAVSVQSVLGKMKEFKNSKSCSFGGTVYAAPLFCIFLSNLLQKFALILDKSEAAAYNLNRKLKQKKSEVSR